eukprot:jgi/Mesvir1/27675/Mv07395-RA.1
MAPLPGNALTAAHRASVPVAASPSCQACAAPAHHQVSPMASNQARKQAGSSRRQWLAGSPVVGLEAATASGLPRRSARQLATRAMAGAASSETAHISSWVEANLPFGKVVATRPQGSSGWASFTRYETEKGPGLFVKSARGESSFEMFKGEAESLRALGHSKTLRLPEVFHYGAFPAGSGSFIVMEYLEFGGSADQASLGRQLALMHQSQPLHEEARAGRFGFVVNNTIGATPQPNEWMDDWVDFFRERRLKHQLRLARDSALSAKGDKLCEQLGDFFEGITVKPSVLHGDLWSGNLAAVDGAPSVFDPATYYGHHEAEFGMSWCAGFSQSFWNAYHQVIPKDKGWEQRHRIYTLYHILNHYNLFGGSYRSQALSILDSLVG